MTIIEEDSRFCDHQSMGSQAGSNKKKTKKKSKSSSAKKSSKKSKKWKYIQFQSKIL